MNVQDVQAAISEIEYIRENAGSGALEQAIYRQKLLYRDVVNAIADGTTYGDPAELCREAIKSARYTSY